MPDLIATKPLFSSFSLLVPKFDLKYSKESSGFGVSARKFVPKFNLKYSKVVVFPKSVCDGTNLKRRETNFGGITFCRAGGETKR